MPSAISIANFSNSFEVNLLMSHSLQLAIIDYAVIWHNKPCLFQLQKRRKIIATSLEYEIGFGTIFDHYNSMTDYCKQIERLDCI